MSPSSSTPGAPSAREVLEWTSNAQDEELDELLDARSIPDPLARGLWIAADYAGVSVRELEQITGKAKSAVGRALAEVRRRMLLDREFGDEARRLEERFADAFPAPDEEELAAELGDLDELTPAEREEYDRTNREAIERLDRLYPPR